MVRAFRMSAARKTGQVQPPFRTLIVAFARENTLTANAPKSWHCNTVIPARGRFFKTVSALCSAVYWYFGVRRNGALGQMEYLFYRDNKVERPFAISGALLKFC